MRLENSRLLIVLLVILAQLPILWWIEPISQAQNAWLVPAVLAAAICGIRTRGRRFRWAIAAGCVPGVGGGVLLLRQRVEFLAAEQEAVARGVDLRLSATAEMLPTFVVVLVAATVMLSLVFGVGELGWEAMRRRWGGSS